MAQATVYIGVDQTGAIQRRGTARIYRSLPAAILVMDGKRSLRVLVSKKNGRKFGLPGFDTPGILSLLDENALDPVTTKILVDCVLGLPSSMRRNEESIRDLLKRASSFNSETKIEAGRARAAAFFNEILSASILRPLHQNDGRCVIAKESCEAIASFRSIPSRRTSSLEHTAFGATLGGPSTRGMPPPCGFGHMTSPSLPATIKKDMVRILSSQRVIPHSIGINSLDCVHDNQRCWRRPWRQQHANLDGPSRATIGR